MLFSSKLIESYYYPKRPSDYSYFFNHWEWCVWYLNIHWKVYIPMYKQHLPLSLPCPLKSQAASSCEELAREISGWFLSSQWTISKCFPLPAPVQGLSSPIILILCLDFSFLIRNTNWNLLWFIGYFAYVLSEYWNLS